MFVTRKSLVALFAVGFGFCLLFIIVVNPFDNDTSQIGTLSGNIFDTTYNYYVLVLLCMIVCFHSVARLRFPSVDKIEQREQFSNRIRIHPSSPLLPPLASLLAG